MTAWLLTWLWQGVAIAVSLSIALHLMPRVNAATRYVLWWGAFVALLVVGWQALPDAAIAMAVPAARSDAVSYAPRMPLIQIRPLPSWALSFVCTLWASVALFRLLRMFPGLNTFYRLKQECRPFPRSVERTLPLWLEPKRRRACLMLCDGLPGAAVLGLHDPYVAVPSWLVRDLSATDLDQILLHESGHVQRYDDWMRLLQTLLESVLWMHPAAFLIGRELSLEREVACDDWVVARTGAPKDYARCLSRVAEQCRTTAAPAFVQALFGGHRNLFRRVDRLLDKRRNRRRTTSLHAAAVGVAVMAACAWQLRAFPLVGDLVVPPATSQVMADVVVPDVVVSDVMAPDVVVPHVVAPDVMAPDVVSGFSRTKTSDETGEARAPGRVGLKADTTTDTTVRLKADTTVTERLNVTPDVQVLQGVRVFDGVYETADSAPAVASAATPWRRAGDAGVGIGSAVSNAGVSLAGRFTKAGTAIARRF